MLKKIFSKIINFIFQEAKLEKKLVAIEARDIIVRFLDQECEHDWEWDDYLSMSSSFSDLEAIRYKCASITVKYCSPKDSEEWITAEGIAEFKKIIDELNEIIRQEEMKDTSN